MMGKIIAELMSEVIEEKEQPKVRVGRLSKELKAAFDANDEAHQAEHEAIKEKIDAYIEEIVSNHSCEHYYDTRADLWEQAYDELGLTQEERGKSYSVNGSTRAVYRLEDSEDNQNKIIQ